MKVLLTFSRLRWETTDREIEVESLDEAKLRAQEILDSGELDEADDADWDFGDVESNTEIEIRENGKMIAFRDRDEGDWS